MSKLTPKHNIAYILDDITDVLGNNLVHTFDQWGPEFEITFSFRLNSKPSDWINLIHLTVDENCCHSGTRVPAVFFTHDYMHITYANGEDQKAFNYRSLVTNKWYDVRIEQRQLDENRAKFKVMVGGVVVWQLDTKPIEYSSVKFYKSDPWYPSGEHISVRSVTVGNKNWYEPKPVRNILKDSRDTLENVNEIVKGFAECLTKFGTREKKEKGKEMLQMSKASWPGNSKDMGESWVVSDFNGQRRYKKKPYQKVAKIGQALEGVCTAVAPIFIVGDLIWGSQEDQ